MERPGILLPIFVDTVLSYRLGNKFPDVPIPDLPNPACASPSNKSIRNRAVQVFAGHLRSSRNLSINGSKGITAICDAEERSSKPSKLSFINLATITSIQYHHHIMTPVSQLVTTEDDSDGTIPAEILAQATTAALHLLLLFLVQPLVFATMLLDNKPLWRRLVATAWFLATCHWLVVRFRRALGEQHYHLNMMLGFYPLALLVMKYAHALLDPELAAKFRLMSNSTIRSWIRVALFCYVTPTLVFHEDDSSKQKKEESSTTPATTTASSSSMQTGSTSTTKGSSLLKGLGVLARGLIQLALNFGISSLVLHYDAEAHLPWWLCHIVMFYQVALSMGGATDVLFNWWAVALWDHVVERVILNSNVPALTASPRTLWGRWSTNTGHHFRLAVYDPMGGRNNRLVATFCTFGVNCLLHVFWWGPLTIGRFAYEYAYVLLVGPLLALVIDTNLLQVVFRNKESWPYKVSSWLLLQILVALLVPKFFVAQGLPSTLTNLSLLNTGKL